MLEKNKDENNLLSNKIKLREYIEMSKQRKPVVEQLLKFQNPRG